MSNTQLWLLIGVPSALVVLKSIHWNVRFTTMERRFDRWLEQSDEKFDSIDAAFESIRAEMIALRDTIHQDMNRLRETLFRVEGF
jgi:hypothetical protein